MPAKKTMTTEKNTTPIVENDITNITNLFVFGIEVYKGTLIGYDR